MLTGQHAVDGVEAHAQQHPDGQQQEEPRVAGAPDTESDAHQQREAASQQGDLVGGGAPTGQGLNTWPQQALEAGFELVDGDHDALAVCHVGRRLGWSVTDEGEVVCDGWPGRAQYADGPRDGEDGGLDDFQGDWAKLVKPATKFMLSVLCEADRMECHQGEALRCFLAYSRAWRSPSMTSSADR